MKYLPLYYEWMKTGILPRNGLCNCFGISMNENHWEPNEGFKDFELMWPPSGYNNGFQNGSSYWGVDEYVSKFHRAFTPLRQNIVLFMAAMSGEL